MNEGIKKIRSIFKANKDVVFVTCAITEKSITYGQIELFSLKVAMYLGEHGIKKGDRVAVLLTNCIEYIFIYFGCIHLGAIVIPINHRLHPEEIKFIISQADVKFLFTSDAYKQIVQNIAEPVKNICIFNPSIIVGYDESAFIHQLESFETKHEELFANILDDDVIIIMFTSGTTSMPKGVQLSLGNLISNGSDFSQVVDLNSTLKFFGILDLAYLGGFYNLMLIPMLSGASIVLSPTFDHNVAITFWETVEKFKISALWVVPSIMSILLSIDRSDKGEIYCKNHIKKVLVGTAPLSPLLKKRFEDKYSITCYENYGLTETFFISTNSPKFASNKGVGKVLAKCQVEILSLNGASCSVEEEGEIAVKTSYGMKGYLESNEKIACDCSQPFFTGDIGYIDQDGHLFITGRKKDLIIRGGINISPRQIEDVILGHLGVEDCAVIGIYDELVGEEVTAIVVKKTEAELSSGDVKNYCKKFLAPFKIPTKIFFTDNLPRSITGKVQKGKLKQLYSERN